MKMTFQNECEMKKENSRAIKSAKVFIVSIVNGLKIQQNNSQRVALEQNCCNEVNKMKKL